MRKIIIYSIVFLFIILCFFVLIDFNNVSNIGKSCINEDFEQIFEEENSLQLDKVYDFSKMLDCRNWDEIIIVGGKRANRTIIYLKEGIALPKIDYMNRISGELLFYFIKDGKLLSSPMSFYHQNFLYFKDFNNFDYIKMKKEAAVFKCIKLETIGPSNKELLTFDLID